MAVRSLKITAPIALGLTAGLGYAASCPLPYAFATSADPTVLGRVVNVVIFTVPGVIIGGQIGPFVQARANPDKVKAGIAILFALVGVLMLGTVVL